MPGQPQHDIFENSALAKQTFPSYLCIRICHGFLLSLARNGQKTATYYAASFIPHYRRVLFSHLLVFKLYCHHKNVFVLQKIFWNTNFRYVQLFNIKNLKKKHLYSKLDYSFLKTNIKKFLIPCLNNSRHNSFLTVLKNVYLNCDYLSVTKIFVLKDM